MEFSDAESNLNDLLAEYQQYEVGTEKTVAEEEPPQDNELISPGSRNSELVSERSN